jgi:hypothetical protein
MERQNDKIVNVTGSVWISRFMDDTTLQTWIELEYYMIYNIKEFWQIIFP